MGKKTHTRTDGVEGVVRLALAFRLPLPDATSVFYRALKLVGRQDEQSTRTWTGGDSGMLGVTCIPALGG